MDSLIVEEVHHGVKREGDADLLPNLVSLIVNIYSLSDLPHHLPERLRSFSIDSELIELVQTQRPTPILVNYVENGHKLLLTDVDSVTHEHLIKLIDFH